MNFNQHTLLSKTDYTNEYTIQRLNEKNCSHDSNTAHVARNNYQLTLNFHGNQGNSLKHTDIIEFDGLTYILTSNRLHQ